MSILLEHKELAPYLIEYMMRPDPKDSRARHSIFEPMFVKNRPDYKTNPPRHVHQINGFIDYLIYEGKDSSLILALLRECNHLPIQFPELIYQAIEYNRIEVLRVLLANTSIDKLHENLTLRNQILARALCLGNTAALIAMESYGFDIQNFIYPEDMQIKTSLEYVDGSLDSIRNIDGSMMRLSSFLKEKRSAAIARQVESLSKIKDMLHTKNQQDKLMEEKLGLGPNIKVSIHTNNQEDDECSESKPTLADLDPRYSNTPKSESDK